MSFLFDFWRAFVSKMLQILSFGRKSISNSRSIYIKTNTGTTLSVDLEPQWHIKNVKELVAPQLGLQPDEVKIIFAGKELSDATTIEVGMRFCLKFSCSYVLCFCFLKKAMRFGSAKYFACH